MPARSAWLRLFVAPAAVAAFFCSPPQAQAQDTSSRAQPAQRLVIQYNAGAFSLLNQYNLAKVLPPSDVTPGIAAAAVAPAARSGFWFDIVTSEGAVLYRRVMDNPILRVVERPDPDDPDRRPQREEVLPMQRVFSLLVPRYPVESYPVYLVFYSSPLRPGARAEPAAEIGRLALWYETPPVIN